MCEILFAIDPSKKGPGDNIGDVISIQDNGFPWGAGELDDTMFRIVRISTLATDTARSIFFRDGVPLSVRLVEQQARDAWVAATQEVPPDPVKIANLRTAFEAAVVNEGHWPRRRFHIDLTALGSGGVKTLLALRDACRRKGLIAYRDARISGATQDVALAAALAAQTLVTDFATAVTED